MHKLSVPTLVVSALLSACQETDSIGTLVFEDGVRPNEPLQLMSEPAFFLGHDGARVVRVDASTLSISDGADFSEISEEAEVVDAAAFESKHALVMLSKGEEQLGEVFSLDLGHEALGAPKRLARYGGEVRLLALPFGALVLQREDGTRWSLARFDKDAVPSVPCPIPQSILSISSPSYEQATVEAVALSEGTLVRLDVDVSSSGIRCTQSELALPPPISDSVRAVRFELAGFDAAVDVRGGALAVAPLEPGAAGFTSTLIAAERVEDVATFEQDGRQAVLVLSDGPPSLTLLELVRNESTLEVVDLVHRPLGSHEAKGTLTQANFGFRRLLALLENRLFVATRTGTLGFDVSLSPEVGLTALELPAEVAALRAPLTVLQP